MKAPFSKGDRVRLKSGGPIMAIRSVEMTRESQVWLCNCQWPVREGRVEVECYEARFLELADAAADDKKG